VSKYQLTERVLHKLECVNPIKKLAVVCKFSYSNENEILFSGGKGSPTSPKQMKTLMNNNLFKPLKNKSKSEEKFNNTPSYQIFLAKYPMIKSQILRFKEKRGYSKSNSSGSPLGPEEIDLKSTEENKDSLEDMEMENSKMTSSALEAKKNKKFKEDVTPFKLINTPLYYMGPVKEEKKEDASEDEDSSSSDSSESKAESHGTHNTHNSHNTHNTHNTHNSLNTHNSHNSHGSHHTKNSKMKPPKKIENNDNDNDNNEDNFNENEISLKKGYMSDENETNTSTLKRRPTYFFYKYIWT